METMNENSAGIYKLTNTENGKFLKEYESVKVASEELGNKDRASLSRAATGKRKTAYGFVWKYEMALDYNRLNKNLIL